MSKNKRWTFVIDFEGGTSVSQFDALTLERAVEMYNESNPFGADAVPLDDGAVPIDGLDNVWCGGGLTNNEVSIFATIIATSLEKAS